MILIVGSTEFSSELQLQKFGGFHLNNKKLLTLIWISTILIGILIGSLRNIANVEADSNKSAPLEALSYSGVFVGDEWTYLVMGSYISYKITSITATQVWADWWQDGVSKGNENIAGKWIYDDAMVASLAAYYGTYVGVYGGRVVTGCNVTASGYKLDTATGIWLEYDITGMVLYSWSLYSAGPSITVTDPTSSTSWATGTSHTITWTSAGSISNVKIELYDGAALTETISSTTTNDGAFSWSISAPAGTDYRVKISSTSNSSIYDYSDVFWITNITPSGQDDFSLGRDASDTSPGDAIGFGEHLLNNLSYSSGYEEDWVKFWLESGDTISTYVYASSGRGQQDLVAGLYDTTGGFIKNFTVDSLSPSTENNYTNTGNAGYFNLRFSGQSVNGSPDDINYSLVIWVSGQNDFNTSGNAPETANLVGPGTYINCLSMSLNESLTLNVKNELSYDDPTGASDNIMDATSVRDPVNSADDGYFVAHITGDYYSSYKYARILRFNTSGDLEWGASISGGAVYTFAQVGALPNREVLLAAERTNFDYIRFQKYNASGSEDGSYWDYNPSENVHLAGIITGSDIWAVGAIETSIPSIFILKMNETGSFTINVTWNPGYAIHPSDCVTDGAGGFYVTGYVVPTSKCEFFVAHFNSTGGLIDYTTFAGTYDLVGGQLDFDGTYVYVVGLNETSSNNNWLSYLWTFNSTLTLQQTVELSASSFPSEDITNWTRGYRWHLDVECVNNISHTLLVTAGSANQMGNMLFITVDGSLGDIDYTLEYDVSNNHDHEFQILRTWSGDLITVGKTQVPFADHPVLRIIEWNYTFTVQPWSGTYQPDVDRADVTIAAGEIINVTVSPYPADNDLLDVWIHMEGPGIYEDESADSAGDTISVEGTANAAGTVEILIKQDANQPPDTYYQITIQVGGVNVTDNCTSRNGTGIMLVIDASGSVNITDAVAASELIIESVSPYAFIGLVIFKATATLKHDLAQPAYNNYKNQLSTYLSEITDSGSTNIYAGLTKALERLALHCFDNQEIIILTDGSATQSDTGKEQFQRCNTQTYDAMTYKQHWISDSESPLVIAKLNGVCISALSIGGSYNSHFFDAVNTVATCNNVYNAGDIWELIDKLQDIQRATEDWEHWKGWNGSITNGSCVEITAGTSGLNVTAKQGYVLALKLWWSDPTDVGTLVVTDQNDDEIPFISPTSSTGDRPFIAYFYITTEITSINIYACINCYQNCAYKGLPVKSNGIQYDLDLDTKLKEDFDIWNSDPFAGGETDDDSMIILIVVLIIIIGVVAILAVVVLKKRSSRSLKQPAISEPIKEPAISTISPEFSILIEEKGPTPPSQAPKPFTTHKPFVSYEIPAKEPATPAKEPATPAKEPATPPPQPPTAIPQPPKCSICGEPTTYIPQYDRYYCYPCKKYV